MMKILAIGVRLLNVYCKNGIISYEHLILKKKNKKGSVI